MSNSPIATRSASALLRRILADEQALERVARRMYDKYGGDARGEFDDDWITEVEQALDAAADDLDAAPVDGSPDHGGNDD